MNKAVIIAIVVAVVALIVWLRSGSLRVRSPGLNARGGPPPIEQINEFMKYSANQAIDVAKQMGIDLDYSEGSVKRADDALEKMHQEYLRSKSQEGLRGLAMMFGGYVGEVIRRTDGGAYWKKDHPKIGENTFPLFWGREDDCAFPVAWCHKRILNGQEDNIVFKLQVTRANHKKG